MFPLTGSSARTSAIINSEEELTVIENLIRQHSDCSGEAGIGGSTNEIPQTQFAFSDLYLQNTSVGKLPSVFIENMVFLAPSVGTLLLKSYLRRGPEFYYN